MLRNHCFQIYIRCCKRSWRQCSCKGDRCHRTKRSVHSWCEGSRSLQLWCFCMLSRGGSPWKRGNMGEERLRQKKGATCEADRRWWSLCLSCTSPPCTWRRTPSGLWRGANEPWRPKRRTSSRAPGRIRLNGHQGQS